MAPQRRVVVVCDDCDREYDIGRLTAAKIARGERRPVCPDCRRPTPRPTPELRQWWLDAVGLEETRTIAAAIWPGDNPGRSTEMTSTTPGQEVPAKPRTGPAPAQPIAAPPKQLPSSPPPEKLPAPKPQQPQAA